MNTNYGNNTKITLSLTEWNDCIYEIESPSNKHLYHSKPVIFTSPRSSKIFCGGADLKAANTFYLSILGCRYLCDTIRQILLKLKNNCINSWTLYSCWILYWVSMR